MSGQRLIGPLFVLRSVGPGYLPDARNTKLSASLAALRVQRTRIVGRLLSGGMRPYGSAEGVVRSPSWVAAFLPCGEDENPRLIGKRSLRRQYRIGSTAPRRYIIAEENQTLQEGNKKYFSTGDKM